MTPQKQEGEQTVVRRFLRGSTLGSVLLANNLRKYEKSALKTQMAVFLAGLAGWMNANNSM